MGPRLYMLTTFVGTHGPVLVRIFVRPLQ